MEDKEGRNASEARGMKYILEDKTSVLCYDIDEWIKFMQTDRHIIKKSATKNGLISTIFLALDHNFAFEGNPMLFETMIFYGPLDGRYQTRCSTYNESMIMHNKACSVCNSLKINRQKRKRIKLQIRGTWRGNDRYIN